MQCKECGEIVGKQHNYIVHIEKMHSDDLNTITNLAMLTLAEMYIDMKENEANETQLSNEDNYPIYQCDFCNYGAASSSLLEVHVMGDHNDNLVEQIVYF